MGTSNRRANHPNMVEWPHQLEAGKQYRYHYTTSLKDTSGPKWRATAETRAMSRIVEFVRHANCAIIVKGCDTNEEFELSFYTTGFSPDALGRWHQDNYLELID